MSLERVLTTDKAMLLKYTAKTGLVYEFFIPLSVSDDQISEEFLSEKIKELEKNCLLVVPISHKGKSVRVKVLNEIIYIPNALFKANYSYSLTRWILENKFYELKDYSEFTNSYWLNDKYIYVPNKFVVEFKGKLYVNQSKLDWLLSKVEKNE